MRRGTSLGVLAVMETMALLAMTAPAATHQIGPGEKKSPARGVRIDVPEPKAKKKSDSLKRLLRK